VSKKMNHIGALAPTVNGFFYPVEEAPAPQRPVPRRLAEESEPERVTSSH